MTSDDKANGKYSVPGEEEVTSFQDSPPNYSTSQEGNIRKGFSPLTGYQEPLQTVREHYIAKIQLKAGLVVALLNFVSVVYVWALYREMCNTEDAWFGGVIVALSVVAVVYLKLRIEKIKKTGVSSNPPLVQVGGRFYKSPLTGRDTPKRIAIEQYSAIGMYYLGFAANFITTIVLVYFAATRREDISKFHPVLMAILLGMMWFSTLLSKWKVETLNTRALEYLELQENSGRTHVVHEVTSEPGLASFPQDEVKKFYSPFTGLELPEETFKVHRRTLTLSSVASVFSTILIYAGMFIMMVTTQMMLGTVVILLGAGMGHYIERKTHQFEKKAMEEAYNIEMTDMV